MTTKVESYPHERIHHFNNQAEAVTWDIGVTVKTDKDTFVGDIAVITLPLGVLKLG